MSLLPPKDSQSEEEDSSRFWQSEQILTAEVVTGSVSGLWGSRGAGMVRPLCRGSGVRDGQSQRQWVAWPEEGKVSSFSEHKLFVASVEVFLTLAHITSSASMLGSPPSGMVVLGRVSTDNSHTRSRRCNSWQEEPGTCLSEKPPCWPRGDHIMTVL